MDRYFGISLPRTGTSSLWRAMQILGFASTHYMGKRQYKTGVHLYNFANDFPISLYYKELDERFPEAKFIFPDRPVNDWLRSYEIHWRRTGHLTIGNWDEYNTVVFGTLTFDEKKFREAFLRHRREVLEYFSGRDDLLVLDMPYSDSTWDQLCAFTGRRRPNVPFPSINGSFASENPWCPRKEVRK